MNNKKIWFLSVGLIILTSISVYFGQNMTDKNDNINKKQMENIKDTELLQKLNDEELRKNPKDFVKIVEKVGNKKIIKAIPILIELIDYRVIDRWESSDVGFRILSVSAKYPATGALLQIGKPTLPSLIKLIESEQIDSIKSQNANYLIEQIFLEDLSKAIIYLEKASTQSKSSTGSERLQTAAQKTREKWKVFQESKNERN